MTYQEYARALVEAAIEDCASKVDFTADANSLRDRTYVNPDAIIASVDPPAAQEHDAPTCRGWWWAKRIIGGGWQVVNVTEVPLKASPFHRWFGPLLPPGGAR